jgi:hypothetical protein
MGVCEAMTCRGVVLAGNTIVNQKERRKQVVRRFLAGIIAVFQFLGGESKIYGSIY